MVPDIYNSICKESLH